MIENGWKNNDIFHKLTKNRFIKLRRYFQHLVILNAISMLKQGIYQLAFSCLGVQEETNIYNK